MRNLKYNVNSGKRLCYNGVMRKRLGILFLIINLIFVISALPSYGQSTQIEVDSVEGEQIGSDNVTEVIGEAVEYIIVAPTYDTLGYDSYGDALVGNTIAAGLATGIILGGFLIGDLLADTCTSRWHPGDFYYQKNYKVMN